MKTNLVRKLLATLTITATLGCGATAKYMFDKSLNVQEQIIENQDKIQSTLLQYAQTEEFQEIYNKTIDDVTNQYVNGEINYKQYSTKMMEIHSSSFIRKTIDENDNELSLVLRNLDDKCSNQGAIFTYYMIGFTCFVMATPTIPFASYCLLNNDDEKEKDQ